MRGCKLVLCARRKLGKPPLNHWTPWPPLEIKNNPLWFVPNMTSPGPHKWIFVYLAFLHSPCLTRNNNSWPPRATPSPLWPPQAPMTPCTYPLSLPPTTWPTLTSSVPYPYDPWSISMTSTPPLAHSDPMSCKIGLMGASEFKLYPLWPPQDQHEPGHNFTRPLVYVYEFPIPFGPIWSNDLLYWPVVLYDDIYYCCVVWWWLLLLCCMMKIIIVLLYDDNYHCFVVWW